MVGPMNNAFDGATCCMQKLTDAMQGVVSDLVTAAAKNITKAPACAVQELMGAVTNKTTDMMDSVAGPIMAPIEKTLGFAFNTKQFLTSGVDMLSKAEGLLSCGEKLDCPPSTNYVTGKGDRPSPSDSTQSEDFRRMFSGTSVTAAAMCPARTGIKSTGTKSIRFMSKIHIKTVRAKGATRVFLIEPNID